MKKTLLTCLFICLALPALAGEPLLIAAGAGYKTVTEALIDAYSKQSETKVELICGNMGQVISQAQTSGKVDLLIGEETFLRHSPLALAEGTVLGQGILVMAWPKGKKEPTDLTAQSITRIAMPDPERATYGKAAMEYLRAAELYEQIQDKLVVVGTVPQILTYLSTGEVDAGFMNLTQAQATAHTLGGYAEIDQQLYSPISITCIRMDSSPSPDAAKNFGAFLETETARSIISAHYL